MFSWFQHSDPDEIKKEGPFKISWYREGGPHVPSNGIDISATGLTFTSSMPPADCKSFNVEFEIREKTLRARVQSKKPQLVSTAQGFQHKFECKFTGIPADEWDLIVRYVNGTLEATHEGSFYDPTVADDEFRMLPTAVQTQIIDDLTKRERLEPPLPGVAPLIQMSLQGEQRTKEGRKIKKYLVHSRILIEGEDMPKDFDTRFSIDENGSVACQAESK